MRRRALSVIARVLAAILPDRVMALLKSGTVLVHEVDYPRRRVVLAVDSTLELDMRVRACEREPETVEWIERELGPGAILFDVGANVGVYALIAAAAHGENVHIYAFEPGGSNYAQLCRNISLNHFDRLITPLPIALSHRDGLDRFHYTSLLPGASMHTLGELGESDGPFRTAHSLGVLAFTLDTLVEHMGLPAPTHLKIDVDGSEVPLLRGAAKTLEGRGVRGVIIEIDETRPDERDAIAQLLGGHGFALASKHLHHSATKGLEDRWQRWVFKRD